MLSRPNHLRLVAARPEKIVEAPPQTWGDVALLGALLGVNLIPLVAFAAGQGRWSGGTLGFATACALVCGRELGAEVRALLRARREGRPWTR